MRCAQSEEAVSRQFVSKKKTSSLPPKNHHQRNRSNIYPIMASCLVSKPSPQFIATFQQVSQRSRKGQGTLEPAFHIPSGFPSNSPLNPQPSTTTRQLGPLLHMKGLHRDPPHLLSASAPPVSPWALSHSSFETRRIPVLSRLCATTGLGSRSPPMSDRGRNHEASRVWLLNSGDL